MKVSPITQTLSLHSVVAVAMLQALAVSGVHAATVVAPQLEETFKIDLKLDGLRDSTRKHVEEAIEHSRRGNLVLAGRALEKAHDLVPKNSRLLHSLGLLNIRMGRPEKAIEIAKRELAIDGDAVEPHETLGSAYLRLREPEKAIAEYEQLIEKAPARAEAYLQLGKALQQQGKSQKALEQYDKALERDALLGEALIRSAQLLGELGRHEESAKRARRGLEMRRVAVLAELALGDAHLALGDTAQAQQHFENVLQRQPTSRAGLERLIRVYLETNQQKQAITLLRRRTASDPRNLEARQQLAKLYGATDQAALREFQLGEIALAEKNQAEALGHYKKALEHDPGLVAASMAWAGVELREGKTEHAEELVGKVLEADPESVLARTVLGQMRLREGKLEQAEAEFRRAASQRYLHAYVALGNLLRASGRCEEAVSAYESAIALSPGLLTLHYSLADCLLTLDRPMPAEQVYNQVLARSPRDPIALHGLAVLYMGTDRDPGAALALAQEAVVTRPKDARLLTTLGRALHLAGQDTLAAERLEAALKLSPENPVALYHLGTVQYKLGDSEGAQESVKRALKIDPAFEEAAQARRLLAEIEGGP